jgi:hypothetical protein
MKIFGVRYSPYENYTEFFTTYKKAEEYIFNAIAHQNSYNSEHGTKYNYQNELYIEEIEVK